MQIDRKAEEATRDMIAHAIRGELNQLADVIEAVGEDRFRECVELCVRISGYIAVDVCRSTWPSEGAIQHIAENVSRADLAAPVDAGGLQAYLSKTVLGFRALDGVFADPGEAGSSPVLMTAAMLLVFCPRDKDQWSYLDEIEHALEAAEGIPEPVLPAAVLRAYRIRGSK